MFYTVLPAVAGSALLCCRPRKSQKERDVAIAEKSLSTELPSWGCGQHALLAIAIARALLMTRLAVSPRSRPDAMKKKISRRFEKLAIGLGLFWSRVLVHKRGAVVLLSDVMFPNDF